MNILSWIILGLVAGVIANMVDPAPSRGGIVGSIILGILGSVVGGFVANILLGLTVSGFNLTSFIVAVLGSLLILALARAIRRTV